jgi:hypothetical protein
MSIAAIAESLVGLSFWNGGRAVEMRMFAFGPQRELQCPWRLACGGFSVVASEDVLRPTGQQPWDEPGGNVSDITLAEFFSTNVYHVAEAEISSGGGGVIVLSHQTRLEFYPREGEGEHWRLLQPGRPEKGHLVARTLDGKIAVGLE